MKRILSIILCAALCISMSAAQKVQTLSSPDGQLRLSVSTDGGITYTLSRGDVQLIADSPISMTLTDGTVYGGRAKLLKTVRSSKDDVIYPPVYRKAEIRDNYNELTLKYKDFSVIFRAYDEGVAYRFVSSAKSPFQVASEQAEFRFVGDWPFYASYVKGDARPFDQQFFNSFENLYTHADLSKWEYNHLAFLPIVVEAADGIRVCISEADLLDYPGMYLANQDGSTRLTGVYAPLPEKIHQGGHNMLQKIVDSRYDYIAACSGATSFPWRIIAVTDNDVKLTDNDMVYKLAKPADASIDFSWVKPGKVAWDWWNDWNIRDVDFHSGINNDTYKYYIDFASRKGIEYVILDEGWAVNKKADLFQVIPEIDLEMLAKYAESRGVGLILWAGYWAFNRDIEGVCKHFSQMGIKGFKVDFMDSDDQDMVNFHARAAEIAAKYHMMLDFHGTYKPTGLHRTWPNVINFEGVHGLETSKWITRDTDQVTYDVTIPFIRFFAGPADYTQGAMRNATRQNYHPVNSEAMSQGTRCRQLAEYVVFSSPLNMLCDSPSNYLDEPECTDFIAGIPTTWDETVAMDGRIAKYVATARRKGGEWYVGAMTDWNARELTLDLGFLGAGNWEMTIYRDGVNADRAASDFKMETTAVPADRKVLVKMAPGGGWAARIVKK